MLGFRVDRDASWVKKGGIILRNFITCETVICAHPVYFYRTQNFVYLFLGIFLNSGEFLVMLYLIIGLRFKLKIFGIDTGVQLKFHERDYEQSNF